MSSTMKFACAAACLAIGLSTGCATVSTSTEAALGHHERLTPDPEVVSSMERQMVREAISGGVQLGASDGLGQSLHHHHTLVTLARLMKEQPELFAGASMDEFAD